MKTPTCALLTSVRRCRTPDAELDDVVASLVLHYLEDWAGPLAELRRLLKPGGRLFLSVNHPGAYAIVYPEADYFAFTNYSEVYAFDGQSAVLTFWHRPLHVMTDAFATAGFRIDTVSESPGVGHSSGTTPRGTGRRPFVPVLPLLRP